MQINLLADNKFYRLLVGENDFFDGKQSVFINSYHRIFAVDRNFEPGSGGKLEVLTAADGDVAGHDIIVADARSPVQVAYDATLQAGDKAELVAAHPIEG